MPPPAVLCLGLGSPTASRDARAQLAFLLAACDALALVCTPLSCVRAAPPTDRASRP